MSRHQPKELTELAFASFTTYMKDQALQLLKLMELSLLCEEIETKASGTCRELKDFFHGTRLPSVLANEITRRLLTKLDMFSVIYKSTRKNYFQQNLLPLVELFMHPDVTSIELVPRYLSECGYLYCEFILTLILMKVGSLISLRTLSVECELDINSRDVKLVLPAQLKKLTLVLCGFLFLDNDNLKRIVECCRDLRSLKIVRCRLADISVPDILQLNHLEALHLFGDGLDAICVALMNGISTDESSKILSASTLRSFGIRVGHEDTLHVIVDKLPHLTEIVLQLRGKFDLSCLTQLKNLRSLTLDAGCRRSNDYKKILPVLGKSLVSLDLRNYMSLDLEFIGETCSNLRCLHVDTIETRAKPSFKTFPNFRTIECLKVNIIEYSDKVEFLIAQCVNIKGLSVSLFSQATVIESILKRTSLLNLEEIHWYPEVRIDDSCLVEFRLKSPNLRLVHGLGSNSIIPGRVGFSFHGCHKCFCEHYCQKQDTPDVTSEYECESDDEYEFGSDSTSDSENGYTSDSENGYTSD